MEEHIRLPAGDAAVPGRIRLYGYQRGIADAIGDPLIERVTVIKSARIGYTTLLVGALANYVHNDPSSLLCFAAARSPAPKGCDFSDGALWPSAVSNLVNNPSALETGDVLARNARSFDQLGSGKCFDPSVSTSEVDFWPFLLAFWAIFDPQFWKVETEILKFSDDFTSRSRCPRPAGVPPEGPNETLWGVRAVP
jgi:hypothetical protein